MTVEEIAAQCRVGACPVCEGTGGRGPDHAQCGGCGGSGRAFPDLPRGFDAIEALGVLAARVLALEEASLRAQGIDPARFGLANPAIQIVRLDTMASVCIDCGHSWNGSTDCPKCGPL